MKFNFNGLPYCLSKDLQSSCKKRSCLAGFREAFNIGIVLFVDRSWAQQGRGYPGLELPLAMSPSAAAAARRCPCSPGAALYSQRHPLVHGPIRVQLLDEGDVQDQVSFLLQKNILLQKCVLLQEHNFSSHTLFFSSVVLPGPALFLPWLPSFPISLSLSRK